MVSQENRNALFVYGWNLPQHFPTIEFWRSLPPQPQYPLGILLPFLLEDEFARVTQENQELLWGQGCGCFLCNQLDTEAWLSGIENAGHSESDQEYVCGETAGLTDGQNQGWERMGYHLSPSHSSFLLPDPNTRPVCLRLSKKWEHGIMPHVRNVWNPTHSTTLMYLIWFMKYNFCEILLCVKKKRPTWLEIRENRFPTVICCHLAVESLAGHWTSLCLSHLKHVIIFKNIFILILERRWGER